MHRDYKRQLLLLPAGYGKSRVIFGAIASLVLAKEGRQITEVQVVYNSEAQRLDEKSKLDELAKALKVPITATTFTKTVRSAPGKLVILDEGDALLLD